MTDGKVVLHITDEMTDAGKWVLNVAGNDAELPPDALVAAIFMAMMSKYDPSVIFGAGGQTAFKFGTKPQLM